MKSPSNNTEGDIKNNSMNFNNLNTDTKIINTGIFGYSILIQNLESKNNYKNNINNSNNNKKVNIIEEENGSEVTEIAETEIENSPKISPGITEVDETEEKDFPEVESLNEIKKENISEVNSVKEIKEEQPLKVEIIEVDKVDLLTTKIDKDVKENISHNTKTILNTGIYDYSILAHLPESQIDEKEVKENIKNDEEKVFNSNESQIPVIKSDNGLWWIYAKPQTNTELFEEEKKTENIKVIINTGIFDYSILVETSEPMIHEKKVDETTVSKNIEYQLSENARTVIDTGIFDRPLLIQTSKSQTQEINIKKEKEKENLKVNKQKDNNKNEIIKNNNKNEIIKNNILSYNDNKYNNDEKNKHFNDSKSLNNFNNEMELPSTIYIIISCSEDYIFDKENIEIIPENKKNIKILNTELNLVKIKNENFYNENYFNMYKCNNIVLDSIKGKNVYLYKVNLSINDNKESFRLKFNYNNENYCSKSSYKIFKGQQLFVSFESFKKEYNNYILDYLSYYSFNYNSNNDYQDNKYKLSNIQKFYTFLFYLIFNKKEKYISSLLNQYLEIINKKEKLDFEFILELFDILNDINEKYLNITENMEEILKRIILSLKNKKEILNVKNCSEEKYKNIMELLKKYKSIFNNNKELELNFNLFLLIFVSSNNDHEKFNEIFSRIQLKEEAIKFIKRHKKSFLNLQCSNLDLLFENTTNKNKFNDILSLASDFNEYLKFFCSKGNYILSEKPKISFDGIPDPDENTKMNLL
eukprot:jgi/Orpsp1_1/1184616/evm.model.c7180000090279.1